MLPLGTKAPDFSLLDPASNRKLSLADLRKPGGLLVVFMCNHCPYVKHIIPGLKSLAKDYRESTLGLSAISSNDIDNYPEDAPHLMAELGLGIPYLYDESQQVAKAYHAVCTPEFYLFNGQLELVYRGQFDDSRPGNAIEVSGRDLRAAMEALLSGEAIDSQQQPGMGCNIKWKTR